MIAAPANVGRWVDTSYPCSSEVLRSVAAQGYQGVFRYVPLPRNAPALDISAMELERTLAAGLQCGLVQHVRSGHWDPALCDGVLDAKAAVAAAIFAGYPDGCHIFLDLENMAGIDLPAIHYVNEWGTVVLNAGYLIGLYVGFSVPLTGEQLYELAAPTCYWSDAAKRYVATRGCAIVQDIEVTIAGTAFDLDYVAPDLLGGLPIVATADTVQIGTCAP